MWLRLAIVAEEKKKIKTSPKKFLLKIIISSAVCGWCKFATKDYIGTIVTRDYFVYTMNIYLQNDQFNLLWTYYLKPLLVFLLDTVYIDLE